ncbi:anti-sigma factor [uncultured Oxalicibacterium sp.]|uniref:anti-sigma factor family protein n=1 Tax=uncultured Oxalicibacterium sp. TaxID=1168540 RepID=UPI0025CDF680|nr:anti-sigma factor [uncultured Oxalicibacterium sp.]
MKDPLISQDMLHAYVDRQLPAERRHAVEHALASDAKLRTQAATWQQQNDALHALFDPVLDESVPSRLLPSAPVVPLRAAWYGRAAAGLVIALLGGAAGWGLHGWQGGERASSIPVFAHQAAIAHVVYSPDVRRPVEVGADQEAQLVTWLSKRTGVALHPPQLGTLGYALVGGRLLPGQSGPVAQFMYEDTSGQRLTLYVSTDQKQNTDTGFRFAREGNVNVFYWIDGKLGYALSAGIDRQALAAVAHVVYEQLDRPAP